MIMKKMIIVMCVVVAVAAFTAPAFAAVVSVSTSIGNIVFTPSTKVSLDTKSNDGATSPPNTYCAVSVHSAALNQSTGLEWGTTSQDPGIRSKSASALTALESCNDTVTLPAGL